MAKKEKTTPWGRYGLWKNIWNEARLVWRLFKDPRVPTWMKLGLPAVFIAYFLFPLDLIPDILPVVGEIDDLMVLLLLMRLFIALTPEEAVREARAQLFGKNVSPRDVVDGSYRVID